MATFNNEKPLNSKVFVQWKLTRKSNIDIRVTAARLGVTPAAVVEMLVEEYLPELERAHNVSV